MPSEQGAESRERDPEATARLNALQGEAERLSSSLTNFPITADGQMAGKENENLLLRITEDTKQLDYLCEKAFEEFADDVDPQQRKNLEQEVFKVKILLERAIAMNREMENYKQRCELEALYQMRLKGDLAQNYNYANNVLEDAVGFGRREVSQPAFRSTMNDDAPPSGNGITKLSPEAENFKKLYEMEKQKNESAVINTPQRNVAVPPAQFSMGPIEHFDQGLETQPGITHEEMQQNVYAERGYGSSESGNLPREEELEQEQFEEQMLDVEEGVEDMRLEDLNEEFSANMFKPISMNDSVRTGSVDPRMQSSGTTPVQVVKSGNQNVRSTQHQKPHMNEAKLVSSSDEAVKTVAPEKSVTRRRSSIPRFDPNYLNANNVQIGESPRLPSPNRRHTFTASDERKTFSLGAGGNQQKPVMLERSTGKVVNTKSALLSKNRPLAARFHNEDNDSGFVGSGPSHFGNLTSENSYSSSRDVTPAHTHSVRRSKTSVGDTVSNRQEVGPMFHRKAGRAGSMGSRTKLVPPEENLTVDVSDRDSDDLDSLGLESPNSSVGSVKRRPITTASSKPKSSSTPKPQMSSIGVEANVKSYSKTAQTGEEVSANDTRANFEEPRESGHHPVSFKFASPRTSAFKSYASSSTEDGLPAKPPTEPLTRRASRNYGPLLRRSELPNGSKSAARPKNSSLASASKFSKSENALEKSRNNQAKIDEIEREILNLKNQLLESVCRTPSTSANFASSTPRRNARPARPESFSQGSFDKGDDSGIARYSDRLLGSEELSDTKPQLNTSRGRISDLGKVHSFNDRLESSKTGDVKRRSLGFNTDANGGSRRTSSRKKTQTSPMASSDSDEHVRLENKKTQASLKRTSSKAVGSDVDSAYDVIYKEEPRRRQRVKSKPSVQNHGTQMNTFESPNVAHVPPTSGEFVHFLQSAAVLNLTSICFAFETNSSVYLNVHLTILF